MRMRRQFVRRSSSVSSLTACEKECAESRDFLCRSFNYRYLLGFSGSISYQKQLNDYLKIFINPGQLLMDHKEKTVN